MNYLFMAAYWTIAVVFYIPAWIVEGARLSMVWLLKKHIEIGSKR